MPPMRLYRAGEALPDVLRVIAANSRQPDLVLGDLRGLTQVSVGFLVLQIVADRLAQPEGQWKPYEPSGMLGMLHRALTHEAVPI